MPPPVTLTTVPGNARAVADHASPERIAVERRRRIVFIHEDHDFRLRVLCALAYAGMQPFVTGCDSVEPSTVVAWGPDVIVINPTEHVTAGQPLTVVRSLREAPKLRQVPLVVLIDPLMPTQLPAELDELSPAAMLPITLSVDALVAALARTEAAPGGSSAAAHWLSSGQWSAEVA